MLSAVEEYKAEVVSRYKPPSSITSLEERTALDTLAGEIQRSKEILSYLEDGEWNESVRLFALSVTSFSQV